MANDKPYNRWRDFVENCIAGDNYFRASEYRELLDDIDGQLSCIADLERQNAELVRQLAAQSKDAARYRWLRDSPFSGQSIRAIYEDGMAVPAAVDAFIDQAMQSGKEPK